MTIKLIRLTNLPDEIPRINPYWLVEDELQIKQLVNGAHGETGSSSIGYDVIASFDSWASAKVYVDATGIKPSVVGVNPMPQLHRWWVPKDKPE